MWENYEVGIEVSQITGVFEKMTSIENGIIIGRSHYANNSDIKEFSPYGVIPPRSEYLYINNTHFYNFDYQSAAALGSCSNCAREQSADIGSRTTTVEGLTFTNVTKRIKYQPLKKEIYYDVDGSLTGLGPKSWATAYWTHNEQPECTHDPDLYDGLICNSTVQVRRLHLHNFIGDLANQSMKILKYDDDYIVPWIGKRIIKPYLDDITKYSIVSYMDNLSPKQKGWNIPFVTGHKYKIHWGDHGEDFTQLQISVPEQWKEDDKDVRLVHNFTSVKEKLLVTVDDVKIVKNDSITRYDNFLGQNVLKKDVVNDEREMTVLFNGVANKSVSPFDHEVLLETS